ncbi:MAG TPA: RDD family protein, partial [Afipia sp.]|nr:RDD family protein [Afipia sp.]
MSDTRNTGGTTSGATWRNNPSASAAYDPSL